MKLDHLKDIGIETIWLSPIYPSPMEDFGYDISDYKNIYHKFGDLADFDRMLKGMKERGKSPMISNFLNHGEQNK